MKRKITYSDLLLLAYNEVDENRKSEIIDAVNHNWKLKQQLQEITETMDFLDKSTIGPSQNVLNNIFNYSKSIEVLCFQRSNQRVILNKN
jgi:hypothetical protein